MSKESNGTVENREGTLVLSIAATIAREKFSALVELLNARKVDMVEILKRDKVVCIMRAPHPTERLPIGDVKIE
jgi:hypothetical protein